MTKESNFVHGSTLNLNKHKTVDLNARTARRTKQRTFLLFNCRAGKFHFGEFLEPAIGKGTITYAINIVFHSWRNSI